METSLLTEPTPPAGVLLYWIPLGAGGRGFVRWNGRLYERFEGIRQRRRPRDLYHAALEVSAPAGRFTIENIWPVPDAPPAGRGVVVEGPVWSRRLGRRRWFRYEVRCWLDGVIPDQDEAVGGPQVVSGSADLATRILDLAPSVPPHVWGRDEVGAGDIWTSNSVVAWLLMTAGAPMETLEPPPGGRAPGWHAGTLASIQAIADPVAV
jgi:hypothetical protein